MAKKRPSDFDVDAAMAAEGIGGDFDVDAAMAAEGIGGAPGPWAPEEAPEPSRWERVKAGARAAGQAIKEAPGKLLANPRQAGLAAAGGAKDAFFLGARGGDHELLRTLVSGGDLTLKQRVLLATPGGREVQQLALGIAALPPDRQAAALEELGRGESEIHEAQAAQPVAAFTGGALVPSPGGIVGRGVTRALPAVGGAVGRAGRAVGGQAVGGAVEGGARAAVAGRDAGEVLEATIEGGVAGGATAAPFAVVGELGRKALHKAAPSVGRYARAADAGFIEHAEALPEGRLGVQAAAGEAVDAVRARQAARGTAVGQEHGRVLASAANRPADVHAAAQRLNRVREGARFKSPDVPVADELGPHPRVGDIIRGREGIDKAARDTLNNLYGQRRLTVEDLVEARRAASETAGWKAQNPTERQLANREIYRAMNDAIEDMAPDVRAADASVTANKRAEGIENRAVFGRTSGGRTYPSELPGAPPELDPNDRIRAAARLARIGDPTEPGTKMQAQLEALAERDPVFREAIDRIVAKKALEDTRFTLTGGGTQSDLPGAAGVGSLVRLGSRNAAALGRQVVDPILRRTQDAAGVGARMARALEMDRERQKKLARERRRMEGRE